MQAISEFQTIDQIRDSYLKAGFQSCEIQTMKDLFYKFISPQEISRIAKLEWMDEFEELDLMQSHYFISIAKKLSHDFPEWKDLGFNSLK